jgi:hypothetical protein
MSFWTLVKLTAALGVILVMAFTGMLAYHVAVEPLGGVFARIIPDPVRIGDGQSDVDFAKMLDAAEMPDIDPGEKAFQKAHELLALGKLPRPGKNSPPSSTSSPGRLRLPSPGGSWAR